MPGENDKGTTETVDSASEFDKAFEEFAGAKEGPSNPEAEAAAAAAKALTGEAERAAAAEHDPTGGAEAREAEAAEAEKGKRGKKNQELDKFLETATPDQLKDRLKRTLGDLSGKSQSIESLKRELSTTQSTVTELLRKVPAAGADKVPAKEPEAKAPLLDPAKLKEVKELYPEIAAPLEELTANLESREADRDSKVQSLEKTRQVEQGRKNLATVIEQHPDFTTVRTSDAFKQWSADAPKYIREELLRNANAIVDPAQCIDILHRFKMEQVLKQAESDREETAAEGEADKQPPGRKDDAGTQETQANRRRIQLESGATAPGKGTGPAIGPGNSFDESFDYFTRKREEKMRKEGRF